jgi:hypothetical protein
LISAFVAPSSRASASPADIRFGCGLRGIGGCGAAPAGPSLPGAPGCGAGGGGGPIGGNQDSGGGNAGQVKYANQLAQLF